MFLGLLWCSVPSCFVQRLSTHLNRSTDSPRPALPDPGPPSVYRGVCFDNGRWRAKYSVTGQLEYLGVFDLEEAAARAHDAWAKELLKFPTLNFPPDGSPNSDRKQRGRTPVGTNDDSDNSGGGGGGGRGEKRAGSSGRDGGAGARDGGQRGRGSGRGGRGGGGVAATAAPLVAKPKPLKGEELALANNRDKKRGRGGGDGRRRNDGRSCD